MQRLTMISKFHNSFLGYKLIHPISLYSTASSNYCFADHLVDSLGFSRQQALSISTRLSKRKKKVDSSNLVVTATPVVNLFKFHGFDDSLIRKLVDFYPRILSCNAEKTLDPKLRFFREHGFSESDIIRLVSMNRRIFTTGVESVILPTIEILRQVLGGCDSNDGRIIKIVCDSTSRCFHAIPKFLQPNVDLLISYGISIEVIRKHIVQRPGCYVRHPDILKDMMTKVENKLGISRNSPGFLYGIQLLCRFSEQTLESKCQLFKSYGWTQSEFDTFLVTHACRFSFSEALIKKKLDFLMNELQYKPDQLISCNHLITCSLEKRIVPRHKVLLILKEKGLLEKNPSFRYAVKLSEPRFLIKFVIPFKEVHQIYVKHTGCNLKMLTQESAISIS